MPTTLVSSFISAVIKTWVRVYWRREQTAGPLGRSRNPRKRARPESERPGSHLCPSTPHKYQSLMRPVQNALKILLRRNRITFGRVVAAKDRGQIGIAPVCNVVI